MRYVKVHSGYHLRICVNTINIFWCVSLFRVEIRDILSLIKLWDKKFLIFALRSNLNLHVTKYWQSFAITTFYDSRKNMKLNASTCLIPGLSCLPDHAKPIPKKILALHLQINLPTWNLKRCKYDKVIGIVQPSHT